MLISHPSVIVVTGSWGAGKSSVCGTLAHHLSSQGRDLAFTSDRLLLEDGLKADPLLKKYFDDPKAHPINGTPAEGHFAKLASLGGPGTIQFIVKDGFLLGKARDEMARLIKHHVLTNTSKTLLVELATGPNRTINPDSPFPTLMQEAEDFYTRLSEIPHDLGNQIQFVELISPLPTRLERQHLRDDKTAQAAFEMFANGDGGFHSHHFKTLQEKGIRLIQLDNGNTSFHELMGEVFSSLGLQSPGQIEAEHGKRSYVELVNSPLTHRACEEIFAGHPHLPEGRTGNKESFF